MNERNKKVSIDASDNNEHSRISADMSTSIVINSHHKRLIVIIKEFVQGFLNQAN